MIEIILDVSTKFMTKICVQMWFFGKKINIMGKDHVQSISLTKTFNTCRSWQKLIISEKKPHLTVEFYTSTPCHGGCSGSWCL